MKLAPRVLIVDDDSDIRLIMRMMLEGAGFEVSEADGGRAALSLLENDVDRNDIVILDVQMSDVDGWDVLRAIRSTSRTKTLPVIICTVKARPDDIALGWELSCDGYITKPFEISDVVREVQTVLGLETYPGD